MFFHIHRRANDESLPSNRPRHLLRNAIVSWEKGSISSSAIQIGLWIRWPSFPSSSPSDVPINTVSAVACANTSFSKFWISWTWFKLNFKRITSQTHPTRQPGHGLQAEEELDVCNPCMRNSPEISEGARDSKLHLPLMQTEILPKTQHTYHV
jgi:hypothetical protein